MKRLCIALLATLALAPPVAAQTVTVTTPNTVNTAGQPTPVNRTFLIAADGTIATPATAANQTASGTSAQTIQGATPAYAADAGNPLKIGCVYPGIGASTATSYTAGQRTQCLGDLKGRIYVTMGPSDSTASGYEPTDGVAIAGNSSASALRTNALGQFLDGTNKQAARGDGTTGSAFVIEKGTPNLSTAQVSVGTSATVLAAARTGRTRITISIGAANQCYVGGASVTTANGFALSPTAGATMNLYFSGALSAVCAATTTISVMEQY